MANQQISSRIGSLIETLHQSLLRRLVKVNHNISAENKLTTNYTYFMREEAHFKFFTETILPYLEKTKKNKVLSIWSAGCSSGEEPYTISAICDCKHNILLFQFRFKAAVRQE